LNSSYLVAKIIVSIVSLFAVASLTPSILLLAIIPAITYVAVPKSYSILTLGVVLIFASIVVNGYTFLLMGVDWYYYYLVLALFVGSIICFTYSMIKFKKIAFHSKKSRAVGLSLCVIAMFVLLPVIPANVPYKCGSALGCLIPDSYFVSASYATFNFGLNYERNFGCLMWLTTSFANEGVIRLTC